MPKTSSNSSYTLSDSQNLNYKVASSGHLGFLQIIGVAQSCHLGNQAEFVLGPHMSTNQQKKIHWNGHF